MKIALVCDDLVQHGGHEKIIMQFCKIFPDAPLYTTTATKKWKQICKQNNIKLKTSFFQKFPFSAKLTRYYAPFLFHIIALENFNFDKYDLVISMSSRFAHGIITKPKTKHICYMSTMGRMFWEPTKYFENEQFGLLKFVKPLAKLFLKLPLSYIRVWDKTAANRPDIIISNSKLTQRRIKKYYSRDSTIIHPFVSVESFKPNKQAKKKDYFLVLTRLVSWKKVDLAISACKNLNLKLKIIGDGPDLTRLKHIAGDSKNIEFLGYVSEQEKVTLLRESRGVIITQTEDFGIVPLEAMASGVPVIAYKAGGVLETVVNQKTGLFFEKQEPETLQKVLSEFDKIKFDKKEILKQAQRFDEKIFNKKIKDLVSSV